MPPKRDATAAQLSDDDDDEYLDELIQSDDEDIKPDVNSNSKLLKGALSKPRHTLLNTKHLHDLIHYGSVELNPAYQRDVVWNMSKMIGLIQSLFMNYYIPPVIFAVMTSEAGDETRICIDGKQRCTAILHFMDGKIPFVSPNTGEKFWYSTLGIQGRSGRSLPDGLRTKFEQISIQAVEYDELKDEQQRDIFQRVQMGVALSAPEKLQAIPGPWSDWILELQKKYITEPGMLSTHVNFDTRRARPFQALAAIVLLAYGQKDNLPTYQSMGKFLERKDPPEQHFRRKVEMAFSLFVNIATNYHDQAIEVVSARVAPIEFWMAVLLIYQRMGNLSLERLAIEIGNLRRYIRSIHRDIRANSVCFATATAFLKALPKKRGPHDPPAAAEEYEGDDVDERDRRAAKRSRRAEEEDPSYTGGPLPRSAENSDAVNNTRGNKTKKVKSPPRESAPRTYIPLPASIAPPLNSFRPPPSAMDANGAPAVPATFGQAPSQNGQNPYGTAQSYSQATAGQYGQGNYTPAQIATLQQMRDVYNRPQQPQSNRWQQLPR
ncbi:hypothetical protein BCR39DRAFT_538518 [Naematelia encephala]|uniref:GmrSD restriction endonucleases N-terminal domain-containing protein n=1 Tax=Naematelia encephala TaxID=71784 RepID=A0A1Y2AXR7_9TREE|nr:hypothetical protein BCR39DRAFT_538518 [Naematelia encephala]